MTVSVKLKAPLEEQLRQRAARTGLSASEVIRAALQACLDQPESTAARSAFELGAERFGRHRAADGSLVDVLRISEGFARLPFDLADASVAEAAVRLKIRHLISIDADSRSTATGRAGLWSTC